jgi:hypothetical protein
MFKTYTVNIGKTSYGEKKITLTSRIVRNRSAQRQGETGSHLDREEQISTETRRNRFTFR